jgi:hypothetical protein
MGSGREDDDSIRLHVQTQANQFEGGGNQQ